MNQTVEIRRWTRKEYEMLGEADIFRPDERLEPGDTVTPLAVPGASIRVADLLP